MRFEVKALLQFFFDTLMILLVLRPFFKERNRDRILLCALCLLLTMPLYFTSSILYLYRLLYRFLVYVAALWLLTREHLDRCAFLAALLTVLFSAVQNVFFSPLLVNIYRGAQVFTGIHSFDVFLCLLLQWVVYFLFFLYTFTLLHIERLERIETVEWAVMTLVLICIAYIKQALPVIDSRGGESLEITIFSVILNIVVVAFLGSFERFWHEHRRAEEMRLQETLNQAYYANLELRRQREEDVRRLHHDMKNHLLALEQMAGRDSGRLSEYIEELTKELDPYEDLVETGNELLNGILSEKAAKARLHKIRLEIQADCRALDFISDTDLCTIFGNALDNAIEACEKVEPAEDRLIRVRSAVTAGQAFITVTNSCVGTVDLKHGLPATTKKDKELHGIGLRSIRRSLEKYKGTMHCKAEEGRFTLSVILPLKEETNEQAS